MSTNEKFQNVEIVDFSGGINNSTIPSEIKDNECVSILNFFYNDENRLTTRYGCRKINSTPSNFGSRITSIYPSTFGNITSPIIVLTAGSKIYRETDDSIFVDITGSCKFPNDTYWNFRQFRDLLIGCNGGINGSGNVNPIKWDGKTSSVEQLKDGNSNAPSALFCEVFNNRLWLVSAQRPGLIYYSKLGDPENFTNGGGQIEIDPDDGNPITAIYAHKGVLLIFKRTKTYKLVTGVPNTDPDLWSIDIFDSDNGAVTNMSIQTVLDNLICLTDSGLLNYAISDKTGSFQSAILSVNVPQLRNIVSKGNNYNKLASVISKDDTEYWIAVPSVLGGNNSIVYVLDFSKIGENNLKWTTFDGKAVGCSYASVLKDGRPTVYIGGVDGNLYKYDKTIKTDNGTTINNILITKQYKFGTSINRKSIERYGLVLKNTTKTTSFTINVAYKFDDDVALVNSENINYTETITGSLWGETSPSIGTWAKATTGNINFTRKVCPDFGNRFLSLQFTLTSSINGQSFNIDSLAMFAKIITSKGTSNA